MLVKNASQLTTNKQKSINDETWEPHLVFEDHQPGIPLPSVYSSSNAVTSMDSTVSPSPPVIVPVLPPLFRGSSLSATSANLSADHKHS